MLFICLLEYDAGLTEQKSLKYMIVKVLPYILADWNSMYDPITAFIQLT